MKWPLRVDGSNFGMEYVPCLTRLARLGQQLWPVASTYIPNIFSGLVRGIPENHHFLLWKSRELPSRELPSREIHLFFTTKCVKIRDMQPHIPRFSDILIGNDWCFCLGICVCFSFQVIFAGHMFTLKVHAPISVNYSP